MVVHITIPLIFVHLWLKLALSENEQQWIPTYHLAPKLGLMNYPSGLIFFNGYSHAFYQLNPDNTKGGPIAWGHAKSTNMLSWEHLPVAFEPSLPEDVDGIFSGSSAIDNNNNLNIMYTGVSGNYTHQMQCLATSTDGVTFDKKGVVLRRDGDDKDFRNPKLWWQDDFWYVLIGSKLSVDGLDRGVLLLYKSLDLYNWEYQLIFAQANETQGFMWECPDLFTLEDKQLLVVSCQGMEQLGYNDQNSYQSGYFMGTWTPGSAYQIEQQFRKLDYGHDFYAPQIYSISDGRTILIGWMGMLDSIFPESSMGWAGMFTLPRELTLSSSGNLEIRPIREIRLRRTKPHYSKKAPFTINSSSICFEDNVVINEIVVSFDLSATTATYFGLRIGDNGFTETGIKVYINTTKNQLFVERYYPEYDIESSFRSFAIIPNGTISLSLDIFVDCSSIEIFVNDGQAVLSSRIYPKDGERILTFFSESGVMVINSYDYWDM